MLQAVYGCCSAVVTSPPFYDVTVTLNVNSPPKVWILWQSRFRPWNLRHRKFSRWWYSASAAISWYTKLNSEIKNFLVAEWDQFSLSPKHEAINQISPRLNFLLGFIFHEIGSKHNMTLELEDENENEDSEKSFGQNCVINWFFFLMYSPKVNRGSIGERVPSILQVLVVIFLKLCNASAFGLHLVGWNCFTAATANCLWCLVDCSDRRFGVAWCTRREWQWKRLRVLWLLIKLDSWDGDFWRWY